MLIKTKSQRTLVTTIAVAGLSVIGSLLFAGLATAQQPIDFDPTRPNPNYEVTRIAEGIVLTNKVSGQSWWLFVEPANSDAKGGPRAGRPSMIWLPVSRAEDYAAVAKWLRANQRPSTERVLQVEIAFAKKQLRIAQSEYGSRHPTVLKLAQDVQALLKEQEAIAKRKLIVAAVKLKLTEKKSKKTGGLKFQARPRAQLPAPKPQDPPADDLAEPGDGTDDLGFDLDFGE